MNQYSRCSRQLLANIYEEIQLRIESDIYNTYRQIIYFETQKSHVSTQFKPGWFSNLKLTGSALPQN